MRERSVYIVCTCIYIFMLLCCLSAGMTVKCPFFFSVPFPVFLLFPFLSLSLSFWGSGHVLLLVLQYSFMFTVPSVSEYSFCFSFLAVDDGEICVKRTGVSASLRIPPPLPRYPLHPPSSLYMHSPSFSSFPSVSFSLLFCGWSKHACPLCGLVLSDIASKVSKHGA